MNECTEPAGGATRWLLIVGLGNPGRKYAANRHNAGFHCLDRLAEAYHLSFDTKRDKAEVALGNAEREYREGRLLVAPRAGVSSADFERVIGAGGGRVADGGPGCGARRGADIAVERGIGY